MFELVIFNQMCHYIVLLDYKNMQMKVKLVIFLI